MNYELIYKLYTSDFAFIKDLIICIGADWFESITLLSFTIPVLLNQSLDFFDHYMFGYGMIYQIILIRDHNYYARNNCLIKKPSVTWIKSDWNKSKIYNKFPNRLHTFRQKKNFLSNNIVFILYINICKVIRLKSLKICIPSFIIIICI